MSTDYSVGDEQKLSFTKDDSGPFWMSDEEKVLSRYDRNIGPIFNK